MLDVRWKPTIPLVCLLLFLVAGCGSNLRSYILGDADVTVNDSANGRQIQVNRRQILDIVLANDYATSHGHWRDEEKYNLKIL